MPIPEIYLRPVVTASPDTSACEAANKMKDAGVGALVLCEGDKPTGVVTDRDLAIGVLGQGLDPSATPVRDLAGIPAETVSSGASLLDVVEIMRTKLVRRVPIVDGDGRLVGIVTADDLVARFGDELHWAVETTRAGFDYEALPPEAQRTPLGME